MNHAKLENGLDLDATGARSVNGAGHNILETAPRRWGSPASLLAEIIRTGHPDEKGNPRVDGAPNRPARFLDIYLPIHRGTHFPGPKTNRGGLKIS